jgi:gliding motility-associated-like protein
LYKWPDLVSYEWTNNNDPGFLRTTKDISGLPADTFQFVVTDALGCEGIKEFPLTQPDEIVLLDTLITDYNGYQVSCFGFNNGGISPQIAGGYTPNQDMSYEWTTMNGQVTNPSILNQEGLPAGLYTLKATDNINCSMQWDFEILEPDTLAVNPVLFENNGYNISCFEGSDGAITLNTFGGVGPYEFSWSTTGGTGLTVENENQVNLSEGTYRVNVLDANQCAGVWEFSLNQPDKLETHIDFTPVNCFGSNNASTDLSVSGGVPGYSYLWNNGRTTQDLDSLFMGMYYVVVTDQNGCLISDSVEISEPPQLSIDFTVPLKNGRMISCYGESDADIYTFVTGGFGSYFYSWIVRPDRVSGYPDDIPYQSGVSAGKYVLYVVDEYGCSWLDSIVIEEPSPITVEVYPNNPTCHGFTDGGINLIVFGGTPEYEVVWTDIEETGVSVLNLGAGEYPVSVTDINGCRVDTLAELTHPDPISFSRNTVAPFCQDTNDGRIELTNFTGGTVPYTITWQDGTEGYYLENISEGLYIATILDNNRCLVVDTTLLVSDNISCLEIPTAFTPNGDGYNDTWEIGNIELYPEARIEIFNRWGELIFASGNGYERKWDGTHKGRDLPIDSYHFIITLKRGREPIVGVVTIIR